MLWIYIVIHAQLEPQDIVPIGTPVCIFSISALFMNCSSARTRVVYRMPINAHMSAPEVKGEYKSTHPKKSI